MKIKEALSQGIIILKKAGIMTPVTDAQLIMSKVLALPRWKLITERDASLPESILKEYFDLIKKRASRYPLGYIIGEKEFYNVTLKIDEGVLIHSPETELLVEQTLKRIPLNERFYGIDLGVGSGAIAIALLKNREKLLMKGTDISEEALRIAYLNAKINNVAERLILLKSDLFESINLEKFDFIVSNPPYIGEKEYDLLEEEVKKEPIQALVSGKEGIEFYEKIVKEGKYFLKDKGFMAFEIGYNQAKKVKSILESERFNVFVYKDFQGLDRIIIGEKNG